MASNILSELLTLREAEEAKANAPAELKDIVKAFPNNAAKAVQAMLDKGRALFMGKDISLGGDWYDDLANKAEEVMKNKVRINFSLDVDHRTAHAISDDYDDEPLVLEVKIADGQECYCGYSPATNKLYFGFDAWTELEEEYNEQFDMWFKYLFGVDFDYDNKAHADFADAMHKQLIELTAAAALIEMPSGRVEITSDETERDGSFYTSIYKSSLFRNLKLIDLRLD
jgi:hypothetical protein